ncbi:PA1571 family protein [Pseudomonas sp. MWU15-20650]|uniref:PA1571 family protein n=1 Tax=Pseudomonas sp. MWU15-20650 TaxID=2933107 RepID=UPI00200BB994|nr:PA1571 family protein [Pseudomonas sp. MWU15-20650]
MTLHTSSTDKVEVIRKERQAHLGCSIIDAQGREVPITEDMIQQACRELEQRLVKPAQQG